MYVQLYIFELHARRQQDTIMIRFFQDTHLITLTREEEAFRVQTDSKRQIYLILRNCCKGKRVDKQTRREKGI